MISDSPMKSNELASLFAILGVARSFSRPHVSDDNAFSEAQFKTQKYPATQFRIWATQTLREFMTKGFVLDDDRLKQGKSLFGRDYFDELLERIREIRASGGQLSSIAYKIQSNFFRTSERARHPHAQRPSGNADRRRRPARARRPAE